MKISLGCDHGGYEAKQQIVKWITENQICSFIDCGTYTTESCDYPDFAERVCADVASGEYDYGILICGTGIGMSMAANRNPKIRAGLCTDVRMAELTRQHNNANVLCLGARITTVDDILDIVNTFLATDFEGGRHEKRIKKF